MTRTKAQMRQLTDDEAALLPNLGVYGCWILKHSSKLPKEHPCVKGLIAVYDLYCTLPDNLATSVLMDAIDMVIGEVPWEPIKKPYTVAIRDLLYGGEPEDGVL